MYEIDNKPVKYRCPVCNEWVDLQEDKNNKPYGYCHECGFQFFFREPKAVKAVEIAIRKDKDEIKTVEPQNMNKTEV